LTSSLAGDKNLNLQAKWEHKTDQLIQNRIVKSRIEDMRSHYQANLVQRKAKLAELLAAEDLQYE
jgi:hypothetical protein